MPQLAMRIYAWARYHAVVTLAHVQTLSTTLLSWRHVKKDTRPSPTFPYCKRQKAGWGLGTRLVQWRAARWMSGQWDPVARKWSKSHDEICHKLHMPTLQQRGLFLVSCQVYKLIHKLDCIPFSKYLGFTRTACTRSHNLTLLGSQSRTNVFRYPFL